MTPTFRSYIDLRDAGLSDFENGIDETEYFKPKLLPGEIIIQSAQNVLRFTTLSGKKQGTSGKLFVTNFKLSFVSGPPTHQNSKLESRFLGANDICLSNVKSIYLLSKDRRRHLSPGSPLSGVKVKLIQIICKDFRVLTFSFKFSPVGEGVALINALSHHSSPSRISLLFAYDYKRSEKWESEGTVTFHKPSDWDWELKRTGCPGYRLSHFNEQFHICDSICEGVIVPASLLDSQLILASGHFTRNRPPVWVWGSCKGAALIRMTKLHPCIVDSSVPVASGDDKISVKQYKSRLSLFHGSQVMTMLSHIRASHPNNEEPVMYDLDSRIPGPVQIQQAYSKLQDLCCPDSVNKFWEQDCRMLNLLSDSQWIHIVSTCLALASESVHVLLDDNASVVLQESNGTDQSCVISSLVQVMADPWFRTINGFQSLIQKDWLSLGHPFSDRLGKVIEPGQTVEAPVFLLFLDCVWQIMRQHPASFEFTETYLTALWDSAHLSILTTFIFNNEKSRRVDISAYNAQLIERPVWCWKEQFSDKYISLFYNPLYAITERVQDLVVVRRKPKVSQPRPVTVASFDRIPIQDTLKDSESNVCIEKLDLNTGMETPKTVRKEWKKIKRRMVRRPLQAAVGLLLESSACCGSQTRKDPSHSHKVAWNRANNPPHRPPRARQRRSNSTEELRMFGDFTIKWDCPRVIRVQSQLSKLSVWQQCYLRWLPLAQIILGGNPVNYLYEYSLTQEILALEKKKNNLELACKTGSSQPSVDSESSDAESAPDWKSRLNFFLSSFPYCGDMSSSQQQLILGSSLYHSLGTKHMSNEEMLDSQSVVGLDISS